MARSCKRCSMSVWVMTSPLTMAVALTTDGIAVPKTCGFSGRRSAPPWLDCALGPPAVCASAALPSPSATAAPIIKARVPYPPKARATIEISLGLPMINNAVGLLNAGLAAQPLQRDVEGESASLSEGTDLLIVASPRQAKL